MRKTILITISLSLLLSCATANLERKLPKDIREWYDLHWVLMQTDVPEWIIEGNRTERYCFLLLPEAAQRMYMNIFWEVRQEGLDEEFYSRVELANKLFRTEKRLGWRTDRGRTLLLCGYPDYIQYYFHGQPSYKPSMPMGEGHIQVWMYYHLNYMVRYTFELRAMDEWRLNYGIGVSGDQRYLEDKWRKIFAPTEEGYDMISSYALEWIKGNEGR